MGQFSRFWGEGQSEGTPSFTDITILHATIKKIDVGAPVFSGGGSSILSSAGGGTGCISISGFLQQQMEHYSFCK